MPGNTTTYTINFKAQADDITKMLGVVEKIQKQVDNGSLKLTDANKKKLTELQSAAQNLQKILGQKMNSDGTLSPENFNAIMGLFDNLTKKVGNFQRTILKLGIPPELQNDLDTLASKLDELNRKKAELSKQKNTKSNPEFAGYNIDKKTGQATVTKGFKDKASIQEAGQLEAISGAQITTYKQLVVVTELLTRAKADLNSLSENERQAYERLKGNADNYYTALSNVDNAYDQQAANIPQVVARYQEITQELERTNKEIAATKAELSQKTQIALDSTQVTSSSKEAAQALTMLHDELEVDGTKAIDMAKQKQKEYKDSLKNTETQTIKTTQATNQNTQATKKQETGLISASGSFGKAMKTVFSYGTALSLLRRVYSQLISTIKEMDKALTSMTVVTNLTREQAWNLTGSLQALAKETGMTSTEVANMTTMYLQQGKTLADAMELTEAAAKAARIAGISGSESINLLTNAMNGFQLEASKAMEVSDKFAALAASAATDYEELATALSKVAAQANLAGMSMDFTLGLLTKGIEVTREAPETIGTALKTVISRMRELNDYSETLEDGMDVNRVEKALGNIGVALRDSNGEFRDLDDVLTEVGMQWDSLNKNQQANVAVALAGTRQQSRLIAMMQDFDRTQQLVNISMNSAGATAAQHRKYMQGLEAATTRLTTSYQELITTFTNSDFAITAINGISSGLEFLSENIGLVRVAMVGMGLAFLPIIANKAKDLAVQIAGTMALKTHTAEIQKAKVADAERDLVIQKGIITQEQFKLAELEATKATQQQVIAEREQQYADIESIIANNKSSIAIREKAIAKQKLALETLAAARAEAIATGNTQKAAKIEKDMLKLNTDIYKSEEKLGQARDTLAQNEKAAAEAKTKLMEAEQSLGSTESQIKTHSLNLSNAMMAAELALNVIKNKGKTQSIALSLKEFMVNKMVAMGIQQDTALKTANTIVEGGRNTIRAIGVLLSKNSSKEQKKEARAILMKNAAAALGIVIEGGATVATIAWSIACKILKTAIENIPIIGWILAIIGLVIAIVRAIKATGVLNDLFDALKEIGEAVMEVIEMILDVLQTLINLVLKNTMHAITALVSIVKIVIQLIQFVIQAINFVIKFITALVKAVTNLINSLLNLIPGVGKVVKWFGNLTNALKKGLEAMEKWCDGVTDAISHAFENAEDRSKRYAEQIAANQEKIYDNQSKVNTLEPLIEEYETLSQKANKSAEDLERLKAIEDEIKQSDEAYVGANGKVDWAKVKGDVQELKSETKQLLADNKNTAIKGVLTGYDQAEFGSALSDAYSAEAMAKAASGEISSTTASAIASNLETAFANIDYDKLRANHSTGTYNFWGSVFGDKDAIAADEAALEAELDQLAASVTDFEQELAKTDGDMTSRLTAFAEEYESLPDSMKDAFSSVYTIYKEYYDLMANLTEEGKKGFMQNLEVLGITEQGYAELKKAYTGSIQQKEGESDEDFAKRQEAEWSAYFGNTVANGKSRTDIVAELAKGQSSQVANAIEAALVPTNQAAIETYMKASSGIDNLQEASKKAAAGTLSMDELRQLSEENPELFADQQWLEKFMKGEVDITAERKKAREELENDLATREAFLKQRLADISEDDPMYESYKAQLNLIKEQQKMIKYADLMASSLWTKYSDQTKEMQKQIRLQAKLNDLEKERDKLNEQDADYGQKKLDLLMKERAIYKQQYADAQKILTSPAYQEAKDKGLFEVTSTGEVIYNATDIKKAYDEGKITKETYEFLIDENTEDVIKDAIEASEEAEEGLSDNIDEMRSVAEWQYEKEKEILDKRKEQYEEYWDKLDSLEEEQERTQSREDILNQLSAVAGGSDAASNSLRKDLLSQLEELNKEEAEARKEAMRDDTTKNIDDHVASIDEKIDQLDGMSEEELTNVLTGMNFNVGNYAITPDETDSGSFTFTAYKTGGLVDYTGPAWVDGTKSKPEAFLSANDTQLIQSLVSSLNYGTLQGVLTVDENTSQIVVENINISTSQLNNNQDFRTAGQIFAEEFDKAIKQRGINRNVKK